MTKIHNDVLGLALKDYISGKNDVNIIVHSPDFEDDIIPLSYYFRKYDEMPVLEQKALLECKGRILDAGAGAGSHSIILNERDHKVVSLDNSILACEVMKSRGIKNVIQQDLFSYSGEKYDTILMLMNGIGLTGTIDGLKNFLSKLPDLLTVNGRLIFDSTNIIYLFEDSDGSILLNLNSEYFGEIEFSLEYNDFICPPFNWLYIDFETIHDICEQQNLKLELLEEGPNHSYLAAISFS